MIMLNDIKVNFNGGNRNHPDPASLHGRNGNEINQQ